MVMIKVTLVKKYGQQVKVIEYAYPYSEYEAVCSYIKKIMGCEAMVFNSIKQRIHNLRGETHGC